MRVLFFGGTGILSRACGDLLLARGDELTIVNRGFSSKRMPPEGADVRRADVRDVDAVDAVLGDDEFDVVVDFVGFTPEHVQHDLDRFTGRTRHYVFISTIDAYRKPAPRLPIRESTPLGNPYWVYGADKVACEALLRDAHAETGFPVTIVRPAHTYDAVHIPLLGEWTALERIRRGAPVVVHGDGTGIWPLTHARDFARAFVPLLGDGSTIGEAFHIASDELLTWDAIFQEMGRAAGVEPTLVHVTSDEIATRHPELRGQLLGDRTHSTILDTSKIREAVPGWSAEVRFAEGAREIVDWYERHPERQRVDPHLDEVFDRLVARTAA